jgi:hypothetical protein
MRSILPPSTASSTPEVSGDVTVPACVFYKVNVLSLPVTLERCWQFEDRLSSCISYTFCCLSPLGLCPALRCPLLSPTCYLTSTPVGADQHCVSTKADIGVQRSSMLVTCSERARMSVRHQTASLTKSNQLMLSSQARLLLLPILPPRCSPQAHPRQDTVAEECFRHNVTRPFLVTHITC